MGQADGAASADGTDGTDDAATARGAGSGVLAVASAGAGSTRDRQIARAVAELEKGARVELVRTHALDELHAVLDRLDGRRLVVLGGDGSIHATVQHLHDTARLRDVGPVALVPLGTGNDLARGLHLPLGDPAAAARVALQGRPLSLELLRDEDGGVVVNAVHVGVGADATARAERRKRFLGKVAYPVSAVQAGASDRGFRLRVTVDGDVVHDGDERLLMVALGLGTTIGGGAAVAPGASPFNGAVDVVLSGSTGPLARVAYAWSMRDGEHVGRHDVSSGRGQDVLVEALEGKGFRAVADGEATGPWRRRRWRVVPQAWQAVVPHPSPPR